MVAELIATAPMIVGLRPPQLIVTSELVVVAGEILAEAEDATAIIVRSSPSHKPFHLGLSSFLSFSSALPEPSKPHQHL